MQIVNPSGRMAIYTTFGEPWSLLKNSLSISALQQIWPDTNMYVYYTKIIYKERINTLRMDFPNFIISVLIQYSQF